MLIGERIRAIREAKHLSQGDVEKRSGLIRVYISRVENDHAVHQCTIHDIERTGETRSPIYWIHGID